MSSTLKYFTRTFDSVGISKVARILVVPNFNQNIEKVASEDSKYISKHEMV